MALSLAERGLPVYGIDISEPMVSRMREKPGGSNIPVTIGDFATTKVEGPFSLVYLVFNAISCLTTQPAQVTCFRNAASHLEPGGHLVIELWVPDLQRLPPGEEYRVFFGRSDYWGIDEYDVLNQRLTSHHLEIENGRVRHFRSGHRYVWPSELDLMAEMAGLVLRGRLGDGRGKRSLARVARTSLCG